MEYKDADHDTIVLWTLSLALGAIIVIGVTGNILCLIVWNYGKRSSKAACATYFKYIALLNLFNLVFNGPYKLLQQYSFYLDDINTILCKLYVFFEPFGFIFPVWMLIVLSFERMLSICFPFKFQLEGARKRAHIAFVILTLALLGTIARDLYHRRIQYYITSGNVTVKNCYYDQELKEDYKLIRKLGIAGFFCVFPFIFINICNLAILVKLCWKHATRGSNQQKDKVSVFTKFCVAIGLLHCISTLPTAVFNADVIKLDLNFKNSEKLFLRDFSSVCAFLSNSLDFFIYFSIPGAFQMDLKELMF